MEYLFPHCMDEQIPSGYILKTYIPKFPILCRQEWIELMQMKHKSKWCDGYEVIVFQSYQCAV